jgi:hypothetical protein
MTAQSLLGEPSIANAEVCEGVGGFHIVSKLSPWTAGLRRWAQEGQCALAGDSLLAGDDRCLGAGVTGFRTKAYLKAVSGGFFIFILGFAPASLFYADNRTY